MITFNSSRITLNLTFSSHLLCKDKKYWNLIWKFCSQERNQIFITQRTRQIITTLLGVAGGAAVMAGGTAVLAGGAAVLAGEATVSTVLTRFGLPAIGALISRVILRRWLQECHPNFWIKNHFISGIFQCNEKNF